MSRAVRTGRAVLQPWQRAYFGAGWLVATAALISPLCALSVALFSARVAQHMILTAFAAPLVILGRPGLALVGLLGDRTGRVRLLRRLDGRALGALPAWLLFATFLWLWHAPGPYAATLRSDLIYWTMHVSLFGAALLLWRPVLTVGAIRSDSDRYAGALCAVLLAGAASVQMGLLGALITLAAHPLYEPHLATTWPWGLAPLEDQQLGGLIMWVPGCVTFLAVGVAAGAMWLRRLEDQAPARQDLSALLQVLPTGR
jgi:putative membrane protein